LSVYKRIFGYLFSNWLAVTFYVLFRAVFHIEVNGIDNYTASPATFITINHKRDLDVPVMASTLHVRKVPFSDRRRMHFIAREDIFQTGYLTGHFTFFGFLGPLVHRINLTPIMILLRAHPISHLVRQRIGPLIREIDRTEPGTRIGEVFTGDGVAAVKAMLDGHSPEDVGSVTVSEFLGYPFRTLHQEPVDIRLLKSDYERRLRLITLHKVREQLRDIVQVLDNGEICMLAPEGQISMDGRFWPVKSGLFRLVSMADADVRILPVNTTYDFMTAGRMRIFIKIGEEITNVKSLNKLELERTVQKSIVTLGTVTMSHMGSAFLVDMLERETPRFGEKEFVTAVFRRLEEFRALNMNSDGDLDSRNRFEKRARSFLCYCLKKGMLRKEAQGQFVINSLYNRHAPNGFHESPVRRSVNELKSLLEWYT
jgi:1-acyl-sn-glycerol-3-phosphate acyltransferase